MRLNRYTLLERVIIIFRLIIDAFSPEHLRERATLSSLFLRGRRLYSHSILF